MEILMIIVRWAIPALCASVLAIILKKLKENDNSNKAMKNAMISLLRSQIVSKIEIYEKEGYLPDYARYCLTDLYEQYKALGGNHGVEKLVERCLELPPIKLKGERK